MYIVDSYKTLLVRKEVIHIKHIFTEIFVRKTIVLDNLNMSLFDYMEIMTNRLRRIHCFNRDFDHEVKDFDNFFPTVESLKMLNNVIVLDFDGVVTKKNFRELYKLCIKRSKTIVCSANPSVKKEWFIKNDLPIPEIYAMKGKAKKIKRLIEIQKKHDYVFYVDDEEEYLRYAWIFGIRTYLYNGKIKYFTLNTK